MHKKDIKKDLTVNKPSATAHIKSCEMTATQRKAYNILLLNADNSLKNEINYKFQINIIDLAKAIDYKKTDLSHFKNELKELKKLEVEYNILEKDQENKEKWGIFDVLAGVEIRNGIMTYSFPHQIMDMLIDPKIYVKLNLLVIKGIVSKYSIALYELLKDYENSPQVPLFTIQKFRDLMGVRDTDYDRIFDLKKRVLDNAVNELNNNDKVEFTIKYELIKKGRSYTHIAFKLNKRANAVELTNRKSFIDYVRRSKANVTMITTLDGFGDKQEIACSEKGLLYDKISLLTFDKDKADRVWNKLYELYQEQKMPWQKEK